MKKAQKILAFALALCCLTAGMTACSEEGQSTANNNSSTANSTANTTAGTEESEEPVKIGILMGMTDYEYQEPTRFQQEALEKWNIDFEYTQIAPNNFEKIEILFATNSYPEFFPMFWESQQVKVYQQEGMLLPWNEYWDDMPDYRALYTDEEWEETMKVTAYKGQNYFVPTKNFRKASQAWVYKKDLFDEENLEIPQNTDELFDVLMQLKEKYPKLVIPNKYDFEVIYSFIQAFDTVTTVGVKANTGELTFNIDDPAFREAIAYCEKLYKNGLFPADFATWTDQQFNQCMADQAAAFVYGWATDITALKTAQADVDPDADWQMSPYFMKSPDLEKAKVSVEVPYFGWGAAMTDKATPEQQAKIAEMLNDCSTDEGHRWLYFGDAEGVYTIVDGYYKFEGNYIDPELGDKNANLTPLQQEGFWINTIRYPDWVVYGSSDLGRGPAEHLQDDVFDSLSNMIEENKDDFAIMSTASYPMDYTDEEEEKQSQMYLTISDITKRNILEFITQDTKEVENDDHWNAFVKELEDSKYREWQELYRTVYERSN